MTRLKKIKALFLSLNVVCFLGFFQAKATEKTPTKQLNNSDLNLYSDHYLEDDNNFNFTSDVIDPRYEIRETDDFNIHEGSNKFEKSFLNGKWRFYTENEYKYFCAQEVPSGVQKFFLDGKCRFYKSNEDGKYYSVNFEGKSNFKSRCYDYLPAVDERFQIKKHKDGGIFYFYDGKPAYRLYPEKDKIFYFNFEDCEVNNFSFKGKEECYYASSALWHLVPFELKLPKTNQRFITNKLLVDPQYEVRENNGYREFFLNGECKYNIKKGDYQCYCCKNYQEADCRRDYGGYSRLPAVDSKYKIKQSVIDEKKYYFYEDQPVYRLDQEGNKVNYVNLKTGNIDFYSFVGRKEYYSTNENYSIVFNDLPLPGKVLDYDSKFDVIDPQYEIETKHGVNPYDIFDKSQKHTYFKLNNKCRFYKSNRDGKYYSLNFEESPNFKSRCYDYLPAADSKYKILKNTYDDKFYYYEGKPIYKVEPEENRVYYSDINTGKRDFYSFKGKNRYYSTIADYPVILDNLILPTDKTDYTLNGGVVDPQYKVVKDKSFNLQDESNEDQKPAEYFMLNDQCRFYKSNEDGKYYSVNFKRDPGFKKVGYEYLPSADDKYKFKIFKLNDEKNEKNNKNKKTGPGYERICCYKGKEIYKVEQEGDKLYYVNLKTGNRDFYSFVGKTGYYATNKNPFVLYEDLPTPGNETDYDLGFDVIDPQYKVKVKEEFMPYDEFSEDQKLIFCFLLDDQYRFYKSYKDGRFYNINFERSGNFQPNNYTFLPAADDKYALKRENGNWIYYYDGMPAYAYELNQQENKIYYVNLSTGKRDFCSYKGIKEYYPMKKINNKENIVVYDNLPVPGSVLDDQIMIKYPSPEYYDLIKKSTFFRPIQEEKFDEKYNTEKNNYNYVLPEQMILIKNFNINLDRFMELDKKDKEKYRFEFKNLYEGKNTENLSEKDKNIISRMPDIEEFAKQAFSNFRKAFTGEISNKNKGNKQIEAEIIDPQFTIIRAHMKKDREIEWYSYGGELKFYKVLRSGRIYDIEGNELERLPRADQDSQYDVINRYDGYDEIFYTVPGKDNLKVTNEGNKTWFSVDGNKKFYSIKGLKGYVTLNRNEDLKLLGTAKLNDIDISETPIEEYTSNKENRQYEYVPDPQYEVVHHNGKIIYFYEGIPKYIKVKDGYRDIESGKLYDKLPIVNAEYFWDKEYEVVKDNDDIYYYVNNFPVYKVEKTNEFDQYSNFAHARLDYYDKNGKKKFYSIKGERNYYVNSLPGVTTPLTKDTYKNYIIKKLLP